jgi:UMF1 family MFS transporter
MARLLERLALHRPELRAWALYDWANSVFMTTILASIFPIYFRTVAAADLPPAVASGRFALSTSLAVTIVALISPLCGALADYKGNKKTMLGAFLGLGVSATGAMVLIGRGQWPLAAALFVAANVGASASIVFYNSLLPHIAAPDEVDRLSTAGFALGYVSGGLLLGVNLLMIQKPALLGIPDAATATRISFLTVAVWWAVFSIPLFRRVPEPPTLEASAAERGRSIVGIAFGRLGATLRQMRHYRDAALVLLGFLLYNDGVNTVIRMAAIYGTEIGIAQTSLIAAILMVQFIGIPFAFLFGALAGRIGARRSIFLALSVYVVIAVLGYRMQTAADFFVVAALVGVVQGGAQALGRSLFASMVPRHKSAEMFGFFGVFDKFGGVLGSALFWLMITLTGSSRPAILALVLLFVAGGTILSLVDVERGRAAAREAEVAA